MPPARETAVPGKSAAAGPILDTYRFFGSLKLSVVLLLISIGVLVPATIVDSEMGLEFARYYIYTSPWFIALAFMLAINVLVAMLLRFPWKRRHIGFLVCHLGLLVLLAGTMQTFLVGVEGKLRV
ncbi:MAG: hypothetical protein GY788_10135, partial [bacterium]|nr:hypothetical protein [bacterium]